jgi:Zn-dependent M28 family amino/carboxypeptidase
MKFTRVVLGVSMLSLAACGTDTPPASQAPAGAPVMAVGGPVDDPRITEQELTQLVQTLASDEFEGRAPGTSGEERTVAWLSEQFATIGLQPGNGDAFFQKVPLAQSTVVPESALMHVAYPDGVSASYAYRDDMVLTPKAAGEGTAISASELVFVGYGIVAPEYDWNDYDGIDMTGKTAVILINDPGFATGDSELFNGKAMTYYGRYTYKYEEARRQGAAAALIIHETAPAAYPWDVVRSSWTGPQFDLVREPGSSDRLPIEGWIQNYVGEALLGTVGMTLAAAHEAALADDFAAISLGSSVNLELEAQESVIESMNVAGMIEGAERPDETLIYMAHWDHFGLGEAVDGDNIYNGAMDNATGTAALIEIAEKFLSRDTPPARSILFLAVTAEEFGLLGSAYYAENPLVPVADTVAAINMDTANIWGPVKDITIIGFNQNEMQDYLLAAAESVGRRVDPEPEPENGYFYRSDHFNLAKKGIPVLYTDTGVESIDGDSGPIMAGRNRYIVEDYHQPSDEWREDWDLSGFVDDLNLLFDVGARLVDGDEWPAWYDKSEFRAARENTRVAGE